MGETHLGNDLVHLDLLRGVDAALLRKDVGVEMGGFSAAKTDQNMGFQQQKLRFDMF
jgi:hypothetical protein